MPRREIKHRLLSISEPQPKSQPRLDWATPARESGGCRHFDRRTFEVVA